MKKTHMTDKAGNPLCECVATGKKLELVAERKDVTCKKCIKSLGWGLHYELPDGTVGLKAPKRFREVLDVQF